MRISASLPLALLILAGCGTALLFGAGPKPALPLIESEAFSAACQEAVFNSTVRIKNIATTGEGTGVIVKVQGSLVYILTAAHIVEGTEVVKVTGYTAKDFPRVAMTWEGVTVKERMVNEDLAVLCAVANNPPGITAICLKKDRPKAEKFDVLTVGCTVFQAPEIVADRVIAAKEVEKPNKTKPLCWETSKVPGGGRSGGPLIDKEGRLLGICSGTRDQKGYYVHIDAIHRALDHAGWRWLFDEKPR